MIPIENVYNLLLHTDRARLRADRTAEIAAIDAGQWPRNEGALGENTDDIRRWLIRGREGLFFAGDLFWHEWPLEAKELLWNTRKQWVRGMCVAELHALDELELALSGRDLPGWTNSEQEVPCPGST